MNNTLTVVNLIGALENLGIEKGDSVIVHSSLKSLGNVENGADGMLDALLAVLGPTGNLMLPTFNYSRPLPEPFYDPDNTPGRTGIIPEMGRRRPGAVRSLHPTHSVAVIGPDARRLTDGHLNVRAFGADSPIDRLAKAGGKVLLLGVPHTSNSAVHVGEEYAGIPKVAWLDPLPALKMRLPNGDIIEHQLDTSPSCSAAFNAVEFCLRFNNEINDLRIGRAILQLMPCAAVIHRVTEMISQKADILLCNWSGCRPCAGARDLLSKDKNI